MALVIFQEAVNEFRASLDEVELYFQFAKAANQLRPRVGQMVDIGGLDNTQKALLVGFMTQKEYTVEVGYSGLTVALAGSFEQFVRRLIRDGVQWINKQIEKYEAITIPLLHQNLLRSGHALATVIDPPAEVVYDYETLCFNLGTCRKNGGQLMLNAEAFAVHLTNMTVPKIDDALERIGVKINWDVFGSDQAMQKVTGLKGREGAKMTEEWLKDFMKVRNRIAHTGIGGAIVADADVVSAIAFFSAFAPVLAATVEAAVKKSIK
jgi:hypothetical protein